MCLPLLEGTLPSARFLVVRDPSGDLRAAQAQAELKRVDQRKHRPRVRGALLLGHSLPCAGIAAWCRARERAKWEQSRSQERGRGPKPVTRRVLVSLQGKQGGRGVARCGRLSVCLLVRSITADWRNTRRSAQQRVEGRLHLLLRCDQVKSRPPVVRGSIFFPFRAAVAARCSLDCNATARTAHDGLSWSIGDEISTRMRRSCWSVGLSLAAVAGELLDIGDQPPLPDASGGWPSGRGQCRGPRLFRACGQIPQADLGIGESG